VLLKIVYLLTCRVLGVGALLFGGDRAKTAELLVLRHENAVLRRDVSRVRCDPADLLWFAALARLLPRRRWTGIFPVTPATLTARPRQGIAQCVPDDESDAHPATLTDIGTRQIRRKPVLKGLINEYVRAA
jgi:putative transposase